MGVPNYARGSVGLRGLRHEGEYEKNVDHESEWMAIAKQREVMVERAKENQAIEDRRNEDKGSDDSDVDNFEKDNAANSEAGFESLHGLDEEQGIKYLVFDPKDMDNPNLEIGMQGILAGYSPSFGIDGTFLKGPLEEILLIVVGIDPNNGFFPITYAICQGENKNSWTCFLNLSNEDLMIEKDYEWTLKSDKQKGIIQTCEPYSQMLTIGLASVKKEKEDANDVGDVSTQDGDGTIDVVDENQVSKRTRISKGEGT
ncbi:hypothetical protein ACH5RR_025653 [Cinchona calisaya]|uniref:MULE transposase domain-containing protein n=1 Tax=Cinchona calisaya TaxID=153742 RepID=A0ABD2Z265_9GENT